jgi:adenosylcobinamide-phosphate synthase
VAEPSSTSDKVTLAHVLLLLKGALYWGLVLALFVGLAMGVHLGLMMAWVKVPSWTTGLIMGLILGLLLKPMLAWRMLHDEVLAVEVALQQDLALGRARLSWLVSRDVTQLTEAEVRESAIETLAENLNDSVVAPLCWFAVAGLPGAVLYRVANTADAMWGYRGLRGGREWTWAGKWAARADDVLSYVPARLTAGLLWAGLSVARWRRLTTEATKTPSPNGGWCMGAMALALQVRLGKPDVYVLNERADAPTHKAVRLALEYAKKLRLRLFVLALIATFLGILN